MGKAPQRISTMVLGLDVGQTSIGWTLLEEGYSNDSLSSWENYYPDSRIIAMGVRIFNGGKDALGTTQEKSRCEVRRIARGTRKRMSRLAYRKQCFRELFAKVGLNLDNLETSTIDPYQLRAKGLDEKLTPQEFARCLYQLCRKRGFWSNRKASTKAKDNSDMLAGANALENSIKESGCRTAGEYFANRRQQDPLLPIHNKAGQYQFLVYRRLVRDEFEQLWSKQKQLYKNDKKWKQMFTSELKDQAGQLIFFQRRVYWRKSVVGICELEPNELRAPIADRRMQEFRILQEINNLAWIDSRTGQEIRLRDFPEQWDKLYKKLLETKEVSFEQIRKLFGLSEDVQFNLNREGRKKLRGMETDALLRGKNLFGKSWAAKPDSEKNEIVRILLDRPFDPTAAPPKADQTKGTGKDLVNTLSDEELIQYAVENWGVSRQTAENLADLELPAGYGRLSVVALEKLIPHLRNKLVYMANDNSDSALHAAGYDRRDEMNRVGMTKLPMIQERLSNPVVNRIASEMRLFINDFIQQFGLPGRIHIELSRDAKENQKKRQENEQIRKQNKKERDAARKKLEENGTRPTYDSILRYRLWQQQRGICPYSGKAISFEKLYGGEIDIDHILPFSQSIDDSQTNKVVCFASENRAKGQRTPAQWLKEGNFDKYEKVLQRVKNYPYKKRTNFSVEEIPEGFSKQQLNDTKYASRYIAQMVEQLYDSDGKRHVICTNGKYTAFLRHEWGLNNALDNNDFLPSIMEQGEKNRNDHRHHAVDALVIALTSSQLLNILGRNWLKIESGKGSEKPKITLPWQGFFQDITGKVNQIIVSHRPQRRIRGPLHEEKLYGPVFDRQGNQESGYYVIRKPLANISQKEMYCIRDTKIQKMVVERVEAALVEKGISLKVKKAKKNEEEEEGKTKWDIVPEKFTVIMKSLFSVNNPLRFNPDDPNSTPIYKVRLRLPQGATIAIRGEKNEGRNKAYVRSGATHHIAVFEREGKKRNKRELVFCTQFEANQRKRYQYLLIREKIAELKQAKMPEQELKKEISRCRSEVMRKYPIVRRVHPDYPNARFLFSIASRESFFVEKDGKTQLVKFVTSVSTKPRLFFRDNRDASDKTPFSVSIDKIIKKVSIDRLGNISDCND